MRQRAADERMDSCLERSAKAELKFFFAGRKIHARPHLLSSPRGEETADDSFDFSNGGSAHSDDGYFISQTVILPLPGERGRGEGGCRR